ncbi:MAG: hypothetical protein A2144_11440 [Chloroflexi bacterium RBG_16_50_9]|nr:MAG: hypothetical protein A2144_11440 [Chloroflexi bacterium RBG_16_50_9]
MGSKKSTIKDWLIILVALLDDVAVLALVFLVLWYFKVAIPLPVMLIIGVLLGTFIFVLHRAVLPSLRKKKVTGAEGMRGMVGEVVKPLKPEGVIRVGGEYWQAKSLDGDIDVGDGVEIQEIHRLKLWVRRKA